MKWSIPRMEPMGCLQSPGRKKELKMLKRRDRNSNNEA